MIQTAPEYDNERQSIFGSYIDDTFRLNSHLTIRAGLRWEPFFPEYQADGRGSHFDLADFIAGNQDRRAIRTRLRGCSITPTEGFHTLTPTRS